MNNPNPNFIHQYSQRTPPIYPVSPTPITQSSPLTCPSAQVNTGFNYPIGWNGPINTFNQPQYQQFQSPYLPNNNQIATSSNPFMQIFQQISKKGGSITTETLNHNQATNPIQNKLEINNGQAILNSSIKKLNVTDSKSGQLSIREILSNIDRSYEQSSEVINSKTQSSFQVSKQRHEPFAKKPNSVHVYSSHAITENKNNQGIINENLKQSNDHKQKQFVNLDSHGNPIYSKILKSIQKLSKHQIQKKNSRNIEQSNTNTNTNINNISLVAIPSRTPPNFQFDKTSISEFEQNVSVYSNATYKERVSRQNQFIRKIDTEVDQDQDEDYQRKLKNEDDYYLAPHSNNVHKKIRNKIIAKSLAPVRKVDFGVQVSQQLIHEPQSNIPMQVSPIHSKYSQLSPEQKNFFHPPPLTKDSQGLQQSQRKQSQQLAINTSQTQARLRALGFTDAEYGREISIRLEQSVVGSQDGLKSNKLKTSLQNQLKGSNQIKAKNKKDLKTWHLQSVQSIQTISDKDEQQNDESQKLQENKIEQSEQKSQAQQFQQQQSLIAQSLQMVGAEQNLHYKPRIQTHAQKQKQVQYQNSVKFTQSFEQPALAKQKSSLSQTSKKNKYPNSLQQFSIPQLINIVTSFSQLKQIIAFQFQQFNQYIQKWMQEFTTNYDRVLMEKQQSIFLLQIEKISLQDQIRELKINNLSINKEIDSTKINIINNKDSKTKSNVSPFRQFETPAESKFTMAYHSHENNDKFVNSNNYKAWQQLSSMEQILSAQVYKMEAERDRDQFSQSGQSSQTGINGHQKQNMRVYHLQNDVKMAKEEENQKERDYLDQYRFTDC